MNKRAWPDLPVDRHPPLAYSPAMSSVPTSLGIIAGNGSYPLLLAESARKQGVQRLCAVAFKRETDTAISGKVDQVDWVHIGQLTKLLDALKASGVKHAVMAGQITPTSLFSVRMDSAMLALLSTLKTRNAQTIFGAVADQLRQIGVELLHAGSFMKDHMPTPGCLTRRTPTANEMADITLGMNVARATSQWEVGQTVVIKEGTVLAVEAFEGTDAAIQRAGKLGGTGCVVVKLAKSGHDMRFDIPVIGTRTIDTLKKIKAAALAIEAGRSILLERDNVIAGANAMNLALFVTEPTNGAHP